MPLFAKEACNESLQLLSNLGALCPQKVPLFQGSLSPILKLLEASTITSTPLQSPISSLINCLVCLTSNEMASQWQQPVQDILFPPLNSITNVSRLVYILTSPHKFTTIARWTAAACRFDNFYFKLQKSLLASLKRIFRNVFFHLLKIARKFSERVRPSRQGSSDCLLL